MTGSKPPPGALALATESARVSAFALVEIYAALGVATQSDALREIASLRFDRGILDRSTFDE